MVAEALRSSHSGAPPNPFASGAPNATPQPFASPQPFAQPLPFTPPQPFASQHPLSAPIPHTSQQPFSGAYAPAQPAAYSAPSDRDLAGHAILSVVLAALAFLGACNLVGLAGVVLGLLAHNDANQGRPTAQARTKTARLVAVVALVLTALAWGVGAAFLIFASDSGPSNS